MNCIHNRADKRSWKVLILLSVLGYGACQDFGYEGDIGPTHWGEQYNSCTGKHQSPIDIDSLTVKQSRLPPMKFTGFDEAPAKMRLTNTGHTVQVEMDAEVQPTVSGGPLNAEYEFSQMHFHWGDNDTLGSEDTIDGKSFPMELHIVFFKKSYRNARDAMDFKDGLAVLAFFFDISEELDNHNYDELTSLLSNVTSKHDVIDFSNPKPLNDFASDTYRMYYTYNGSLTTPPCSEIVTWIDFTEPIPLSHDQLEMFRAIQDGTGETVKHNFRPIQPIGDRIVIFSDAADIPPVDGDYDLDITNDLQEITTSKVPTSSTNNDRVDHQLEIEDETDGNSVAKSVPAVSEEDSDLTTKRPRPPKKNDCNRQASAFTSMFLLPLFLCLS